jgi:hypothetical protein
MFTYCGKSVLNKLLSLYDPIEIRYAGEKIRESR